MPAAVHLLRAKPDPRGRVALGKAIEAINHLLATEITGFDIVMHADGSLLLTPMVEIPARRVIQLNPQDFAAFTENTRVDSGPNAELLAAADAVRAELGAGTVKVSSDLKPIDLEHAEKPRLPRHRPGTQEPARAGATRKGGVKRDTIK